MTAIDVPQPTAVLASLSGGEQKGNAARAFIASLDGTVGVYSVGGLATRRPTVCRGTWPAWARCRSAETPPA